MHAVVENGLLTSWKQLSAFFRREPKLIGQPVNNIAEADFFVCWDRENREHQRLMVRDCHGASLEIVHPLTL